ncbi:MAG: hypothetical protein J1G05_03220 [Clostridiales bacterium]|nr:hypothetical protein [Clostridiales bacterium]
MKKAKKAGGTIAYLNALSRSYIPPVKRGVGEVLPVALCGLISFLAIYQARAPYGAADRFDFTTLIFLFALIEFIVCAITVSVSRHRPNLQSLFPMAPKKKLVLRLTGGLIISLFWFVTVLAAFFILLAIPFLLMGILVNLWEGMRFYIELYSNAFPAIDGLGYVFLLIWLILTYGAAVLCGSTNRGGLRWGVAGGYALFSVVFTLVTTNLLNGGDTFVLRNTVVQNFNSLPLAWLWITVLATASAGLCVFAVIYAIKQSKEADF